MPFNILVKIIVFTVALIIHTSLTKSNLVIVNLLAIHFYILSGHDFQIT